MAEPATQLPPKSALIRAFARVEHVSVAGKSPQPNEDQCFVDAAGGKFVLADGVTRSLIDGVYPEPSPAEQASKRFVGTSSIELRNPRHHDAPALETVRSAAVAGNSAVGALNRELFNGNFDYIGRDPAGTVGILAMIRDERLAYGYVGDVSGHLIRDGVLRKFTVPQTTLVENIRRKHGYDNATTLRIRRDIRNNPSDAAGYGVFTGDPRALEFLRLGEIDLTGVSRIIFNSGGLDHFIANHPSEVATWRAESIVSMAQHHEKLGGPPPDDKTVIIIDR